MYCCFLGLYFKVLVEKRSVKELSQVEPFMWSDGEFEKLPNHVQWK